MLRCAVSKISKTVPVRSVNGFRIKARLASTADPESKQLPKEADVVVIGGGAIGCGVAYYLSKFSSAKVVLLDKHDISSGTTWHSEALIWQLRPSDIDVQLLKCTMDLAQSLPQESGMDIGLVKNGGLFIASRKERLDEYRRLHTIGKLYGVDSQILAPSDVARLFPQVNTSDMYGALYSPTDGSIEPNEYCKALVKAAEKSNRVTTVPQCGVTKLLTTKNNHGRKVLTGVETPQGTIKTNVAVLCSGLWAPLLLRPLGMELPLCSFYHTYIITAPDEHFSNMPNIRDHDGSCSTKLQGKSLCVAGYEPDPTYMTEEELQAGANKARLLGSANWNAFSKIMTNATNRVPHLKEARISSTVCGPEAFTPDHKPLMGETPEVAGLFLGCGFNAGGIMYSAGSARELARWVVNGKPDLDLFAYDYRRFNPAGARNDTWVKERSHEAYATNYSIVYRNDFPLAGRNLKKDALHGALQAEGCVYQEKGGWERPSWFSKHGDRAAVREYDFGGAYGYAKHAEYLYADLLKKENTFDMPLNFAAIKRECNAVKMAASMTNLSSRGKFYLVGRDAYRAADWLFSNDIPRQYGAVVPTLLLNKQAGLEVDTTVCVINNFFDPLSLSFDRNVVTRSEIGENREEEDDLEPYYYYLTVDSAVTEKFRDLVNREIEAKDLDCSLLDATEGVCTMLLMGPKSREILGLDIPNLNHKVVVLGDALDRFKCRILQFWRVGEPAYELHVPSRDGRRLFNYLKRRGAMYGLLNVGYRALDSISLENAVLHCPTDLRNNETPIEAGLQPLCKLDSPRDFLGKKVLLQQNKEDLQRRLIRLTIRKNVMLHGLETIHRNGVRVGCIRRAEFGHASGKVLACGYVEKSFAKEVLSDNFIKEGQYQIERMGELIDADVSLMQLPQNWTGKQN